MRRALLAACAVMVCGCAPSHPVSVGNRDVATDILLKGAAAATPAPPPVQPGFPLAPVPAAGAGGSTSVVPLPPAVAPVPTPASCPTASPLVGARDAATPLPPGPPRPHSYVFAEGGSYRIGSGSTARTGAFGPLLTHTIGAVTTSADGWSFVDSDSEGMSVTYDVYPHQRVASQEPVGTDQAASQPTEAGIYVRTFTYKRADNSTETLSPQPELLVAPLPLSNAGTTWRARGVDPTTGIAVVIDGQVGLGKHFSPTLDRIDACGTVLQAYWVEFTIAADNSAGTGVNTATVEPASSLRGADLDVRLVGTRIAFATQYGGIPLDQADLVAGTDGSLAVDISRTETIRQPPLPATSG